ncbi:MAG: pyridoxal phosphate-dependent decarboxylase family protein [Pseudonocardiaceae bacterium]
MLEIESLTLLQQAVEYLDEGFDDLPQFQEEGISGMSEVLLAVAARMRDNYPYPHPLYAGQMLKPPHPLARLAYSLALWINPNNHALDGGRASSAMEKEAVAEIAKMFEWTTYLGHLCGGGTMANLEALWVANQAHPGKTIVASQQAHYTHRRITGVLQIPFQTVPCDQGARMDVKQLESVLQTGVVGTVIATMGSTATGSVDPLPALLDLQKTYGFRLHADAAYGGYFTLVDNLRPDTRESYENLHRVDSIAIDPHKHGLQPYGCGCILFSDPGVGALYEHNSPYTYFTSKALHLGEISIECSRPGASAVALWATQRLLPLVRGGAFSSRLEKSRSAAQRLAGKIRADARWLLAFEPELDVVIWAPRGTSASEISRRSHAIFSAAALADLHLAVASFPATLLKATWDDLVWDQNDVVCLRSCLMKPEHLDWVERIWHTLNKAADQVVVREGTGHADHLA